MTSKRTRARNLARESLAKEDACGWFQRLYTEAAGDESIVPWADMRVNPNLSAWLHRKRVSGEGRPALVVGCGLGDDAEALARLGFDVLAFDLSTTAIDWCGQRFAGTSVRYVVADLFAPPDSWQGAFDFVLEAYTLQVLPTELRQPAGEQIASFVAPGGTLLVISRGRGPEDNPGEMPWPLLRSELTVFTGCGLIEANFEDDFDDEQPPVRRFRAEYQRPPTC